MRRHGSIASTSALMLVLLGASSCGGGTPRSAPTSTTSPSSASTEPTPLPTTTTTTTAGPPPVTAGVTVRPDQGPPGTFLTFTVAIHGAGTLQGEGVHFGDGGTSGANAGDVPCGATARADRTSTYTHTYTRAGTYRFTDQVTVQAPPPSCAYEHATARVTVIVGTPLSDATLNGAFMSPTGNIGCYIDPAPPGALRCASFSPPRLVTMNASGSIQMCSGNQCNLGNPAMETPALPYGTATAGGPFQCLSTREGMLCTVVGHKGFRLSTSGVEAIG